MQTARSDFRKVAAFLPATLYLNENNFSLFGLTSVHMHNPETTKLIE
jgi:hypothetical protein